MNTHANKSQENKKDSASSQSQSTHTTGETNHSITDNRPDAIAQRKLQETINNSYHVKQLKANQEIINNSPQVKEAAQLQKMADNYSAVHKKTIDHKPESILPETSGFSTNDQPPLQLKLRDGVVTSDTKARMVGQERHSLVHGNSIADLTTGTKIKVHDSKTFKSRLETDEKPEDKHDYRKNKDTPTTWFKLDSDEFGENVYIRSGTFQFEQLNPFDETFQDFPQEELFRMFIDKDRQNGGAKTFDIKEPGYHDAMLNTFLSLRDSMGVQFDAEDYIALHDSAIDGVRNESNHLFEKGIGPGTQQYGLKKAMSENAYQELKEEGVLKDIMDKGPSGNSFKMGNRIHAGYKKSDDHQVNITEAKRQINALFDQYYTDIAQEDDRDAKLGLILKLCRALEVGHYFRDGNQRTVVFLLLNKLLLENGFNPVILDEPTVFDGYLTIQELKAEIVKGNKNFKDVKKGRNNF